MAPCRAYHKCLLPLWGQTFRVGIAAHQRGWLLPGTWAHFRAPPASGGRQHSWAWGSPSMAAASCSCGHLVCCCHGLPQPPSRRGLGKAFRAAQRTRDHLLIPEPWCTSARWPGGVWGGARAPAVPPGDWRPCSLRGGSPGAGRKLIPKLGLLMRMKGPQLSPTGDRATEF